MAKKPAWDVVERGTGSNCEQGGIVDNGALVDPV
jgi:hypothetical protein